MHVIACILVQTTNRLWRSLSNRIHTWRLLPRCTFQQPFLSSGVSINIYFPIHSIRPLINTHEFLSRHAVQKKRLELMFCNCFTDLNSCRVVWFRISRALRETASSGWLKTRLCQIHLFISDGWRNRFFCSYQLYITLTKWHTRAHLLLRLVARKDSFSFRNNFLFAPLKFPPFLITQKRKQVWLLHSGIANYRESFCAERDRREHLLSD